MDEYEIKIKILEHLKHLKHLKSLGDTIGIIHEDDEDLSAFQAHHLIITWLESNGFESNHDWTYILSENRRPGTGRKSNAAKWGLIPFSRRRNRIIYNKREVIHWLSRNIHNFTPIKRAS